MSRRKWSPSQKAKIVLEGIKGGSIQEICNAYEISQAQYYQWRDHFLSHIDQAFISHDQKHERLMKKKARLERMVGELTMELKKSEEELW